MIRHGVSGHQQPIASLRVATVVSQALFVELRNSVRGTRQPMKSDPQAHPPAESFWGERIADTRGRLFRVVQAELAALGADMGTSFSLVGVEGDLAERLEILRGHILEGRPVVSLSMTGDLEKLLAHGDPRAASFSVLVWLPTPPLAAATVTLESALTADCDSAYRMSVPGEWELLTEDTPVAAAGEGHLVFPRSLMSRAHLLTDDYPEISYEDETASVIIQAVLNHSVPVAIHSSGHVLDSAILLVAAAHRYKLAVRMCDARVTPMASWEASKLLYRAIRDGKPLPDVVIARDKAVAERIAGLVGSPAR
jgi:hypothetical protein